MRSLRTALLIVAVGVVAGVVTSWLVARGGGTLDPVYAAGVAVTGLALARLIQTAHPGAAPPPAAPLETEPVPEPASFRDLAFLEERLSWSSVDRQRYEDRVRPFLVRLAEERFRQRHGIEFGQAGERARSLVGEDVWRFLIEAPDRTARPPSQRELANLVDRIARL